MNYYRDIADKASDLAKKVAETTENEILSQLGDLVKKGLIVVEQTAPTLVQDQFSDQIRVMMKINLKLKDQEYIKELEDTVLRLTKILTNERRATREVDEALRDTVRLCGRIAGHV